MSIFYPAIFHPEDIGYSVKVSDIDGCFSEGDTLDDACHYTKEAEKQHVNFSSVLQSALKQHLNV